MAKRLKPRDAKLNYVWDKIPKSIKSQSIDIYGLWSVYGLTDQISFIFPKQLPETKNGCGSTGK